MNDIIRKPLKNMDKKDYGKLTVQTPLALFTFVIFIGGDDLWNIRMYISESISKTIQLAPHIVSEIGEILLNPYYLQEDKIHMWDQLVVSEISELLVRCIESKEIKTL